MTELFDSKERIQAMIEDNGNTWDLSVNDKKALRFAFDIMNESTRAASPSEWQVPEVELEITEFTEMNLVGLVKRLIWILKKYEPDNKLRRQAYDYICSLNGYNLFRADEIPEPIAPPNNQGNTNA